MPEESSFLRTICDHPDDDLPRLVYCDWLDENGQSERAEFIRIQIELSESSKYVNEYADCPVCDGTGYTDLPPCCRVCSWCLGIGKKEYQQFNDHLKLLNRQLKLWQLHGPAWFGGLTTRAEVVICDSAGEPDLITTVTTSRQRPDVGRPVAISMLVVRRGFVDEYYGPADVWWGVTCVRCRGIGHGRDMDGAPADCQLCRGRGYRDGLGPDVAAVQPVRKLTWADRWPVTVRGRDGEAVWFCDEVGHSAAVPRRVFRYLSGQTDVAAVSRSVKDAEQALVRAALRWAKKEAELNSRNDFL